MKDKIFVPAGSQITDIREHMGLTLIHYKGPLYTPAPICWAPILSLCLSIFAVILSAASLVMRFLR